MIEWGSPGKDLDSTSLKLIVVDHYGDPEILADGMKSNPRA